MKRFTTILCSTLFAIFGIGLALSGLDSIKISKAQLANAGNVTQYTLPRDTNMPNENTFPVFDCQNLPLDLQLGQDNASKDTSNVTKNDVSSGVIDSLENRIKILERRKQVTKVKWKTAPAPPPVVKEKIMKVQDTIVVPVYYLATQVGNKERPTGKCISVYEVHQVDEICPEDTNSSTKHVKEHDDKQVSTIRGSHQPGCEIVQLDPRICQPAQRVRNPKGRMKYYKFYAYYIVEKLIVRG